jgi:hypothetical protein
MLDISIIKFRLLANLLILFARHQILSMVLVLLVTQDIISIVELVEYHSKIQTAKNMIQAKESALNALLSFT